MDFSFRCRCWNCDNDTFYVDSDIKGEKVALKCSECEEPVSILHFFDFTEGVKKADEEANKPFD